MIQPISNPNSNPKNTFISRQLRKSYEYTFTVSLKEARGLAGAVAKAGENHDPLRKGTPTVDIEAEAENSHDQHRGAASKADTDIEERDSGRP